MEFNWWAAFLFAKRPGILPGAPSIDYWLYGCQFDLDHSIDFWLCGNDFDLQPVHRILSHRLMGEAMLMRKQL
jgi:hypothetical protein